MHLNQTNKKTFDFLQQWQSEYHIYNFEQLHSIYFYEEESEYLERNFDEDLTEHITDKFVTLGIDGAGGSYCFWHYPGLEGEAPIVLLDSEGGSKFLANSLNDFVCRMINEIEFCGGWICEGQDPEEELENELYDLANNYNEEKGKSISETTAKDLLIEERKLFKEKLLPLITYKTREQTQEKLHPSFNLFVTKAEIKTWELPLIKKYGKKDLHEYDKFYEWLEKIIEAEYYEANKASVIQVIKDNYATSYNTQKFQAWIKS